MEKCCPLCLLRQGAAKRVFQKSMELSEIIMEINDLQKTFLDNQPLAQTVLEINDLREFDRD